MSLIERDGKGGWNLEGVPWEELRGGAVLTKKTAERLYGALCKLKDYEATGLSPDGVEQPQDDFDEVNNFQKTQAAKLMEKYQRLLARISGRRIICQENNLHKNEIIGEMRLSPEEAAVLSEVLTRDLKEEIEWIEQLLREEGVE